MATKVEDSSVLRRFEPTCPHCRDESALGLSRPFDIAYAAPNAAMRAEELAQPPQVNVGPDGTVVIEVSNAEGAVFVEGRVLRIDHMPPFALVHVLELGPPEDPYDAPLYAGYLVWETSLLSTEALLEAQLRQRYGESLTIYDLIAASGVVRHTIYAALRNKRLHGTKQGRSWLFTPEQAAAWIPQAKPRRKS